MNRSFVENILGGAAEIALSWFGNTEGIWKDADPIQVVTEADLEIGRYLIERIRAVYPAHSVIEEEHGVTAGTEPLTWVVDPIDGTSNYAAHLPMYGIAVGLLENDFPILGGVVLPAFGELYLAERGGGAFCNGKKISVDADAELRTALVAYGIDGKPDRPESTRAEMATLAEITLGIRNLRTSNSAFDQMMVACGKYAACLNRSSRIWDNVAAQVIIEEAGGRYTDFEGRALSYAGCLERSGENFTWCTGAPGVHGALQAIIRVTAAR